MNENIISENTKSDYILMRLQQQIMYINIAVFNAKLMQILCIF